MNKRLVHIVWTLLICVMLAGFGILHSCVGRQDSRKLCESLDVQIRGRLEFVSEEDIRGRMDKMYGAYIGAPLDSIDLGRIERLMEEQKAVRKCEAWTTRNGVLHVSIEQREPALRFMGDGRGFYIDREGVTIPLHPSYTAPVPVIEGMVPDMQDEGHAAWAAGVLELTDFISSSKAWKDRVEKISVGKASDIELRLDGCRERFILGAPDGIRDKFDRIGKYFAYIVPAKGEGYYKSVNLKYNHQIICRKDI
ncbi:MAG: hypothetical protein IK031_06980 [Bacteroidales bacterium]|nr:hypothetical protein [Bacteroidales bacterium]